MPTLSFARENIKYCREFLGKIKRSPVDFNFRVELSVTLSFNPYSLPASQPVKEHFSCRAVWYFFFSNIKLNILFYVSERLHLGRREQNGKVAVICDVDPGQVQPVLVVWSYTGAALSADLNGSLIRHQPGSTPTLLTL